MGTCGRRFWLMGPGFAEVQASHRRVCVGGFVGDRCAQMAKRELRQWNRAGARWGGVARGNDAECGLSGAGHAARADAQYSRGIAPGTRYRTMGGIEVARTIRIVRIDRAHVFAGKTIREWPARGWS